MKKKILLGTGASVLLVAAAFAGRMSAKFIGTGLYYTQGTSVCSHLDNSQATSVIITASNPNAVSQATISTTATGAALNLYVTAGCNTASRAFFKP